MCSSVPPTTSDEFERDLSGLELDTRNIVA